MNERAKHSVIDLCDAFTRGEIGRRDFLDRLARMLGSSAAAMWVLPFVQNGNAVQSIPQQDDRLNISEAQWDAEGTIVSGYLARLRGAERRPGVIVIHENRGLNAHIRDVTRRFALEGFLTLAPDSLSPMGGTPPDENRAVQMIRSLEPEETLVRIAAAVPFLAGHPESTGKVGAVGFCWGGGYANQLAATGTSLNASVPYYGRQIPAEQVPNITAPLCLHYAGNDERINAGIADYEAALKANNKTYELYMYEGASHAFNNDTNEARYNKEAADLAWGRTIAFLKRNLAS